MNEEIRKELLQIKGASQLLHAEDVVDWAQKHTRSALHARFEWDDSIAGHQWRLDQARRLIALHVVASDGTRQFVSLSIDRKAGGGYRETDKVMRQERLRSILLRDALREFAQVRNKYDKLTELAEIYSAIDRAETKFAKPVKTALG